MKRKLLFYLYFCTLATFASAQSMLTPGLQWNVDQQSFFSPDRATVRYRIGADTLVGDTTYRIVVASGMASGDDFAPTAAGILLREGGRGRVYGRSTESGRGGLLYDFTAETGDTLRTCNPNYPDGDCEQIVVATGDTTLADGTARRTYRTRDDYRLNGRSLAIEGIGSVDGGPFGLACLLDVGDRLRCVYSPNQALLLDSSGGDCFVSAAPEISTAAPGTAYPSPFAGHLSLDFARIGGESYTLLDARGARVQSGTLVNGCARLTTAEFPVGVYAVLVERRDGGRSVVRVIKS